MKKRIFRTLAGLFGLVPISLVLMLVWPRPNMPRPGIKGDFLIQQVMVVDVVTGGVEGERNVLIQDGVIDTIETGVIEELSDSVRLIDGRGRFLIPALWDMHTHSNTFASQYQHPLFIANGVTGVRDLWGCMSKPDSFFACTTDRQAWNQALKDGSGLSPRYVGQSSFQINGGSEVPEGFEEFFKARTAKEARQLVAFYASVGVDILKTYTDLSPEAYAALASQARLQGLSLDGHRPIRVSLPDTLAAGQRSIEHARLFLLECYQQAEEFRDLADPLGAYTAELRKRLVDEQDEHRCQLLMRAMAESDTWWTPTLQTLRMNALAGDAAFRSDARLKYIPYLFKQLFWNPDANRMAESAMDKSGRNIDAEIYSLALRHVGLAHKSGVKILTGTDAFDSYVYPGFSTHDELVELVAAGLSPAAALRTATIDAALFSGAEDRYGSIAVGKSADLLLLSANPLDNIRNTQKIDGLLFNGQYFDRSALNVLLQFAQDRAGSIHNNLNILWDALNSPLLRMQFAD